MTDWSPLERQSGVELLTDDLSRLLAATDASIYQQLPLAVVRPRDEEACQAILAFADRAGLGITARGAATSLAGQAVGGGLVVDMRRYMDAIEWIQPARRLVRVQPGIVLQDLNDRLRPLGLHFPVDPSTASRCTLGGMLANNAWGVHTPRYGTTRDWVRGCRALLGDGSAIELAPLDATSLDALCGEDTPAGRLHAGVRDLVERHRGAILDAWPSRELPRNNMGYALDRLARGRPWQADGPDFDLTALVAGSEGTLCLVTAMTLALVPLPGRRLMLCPHFRSLHAAVSVVSDLLGFEPAALELLDRHVLERAADSPEQRSNRFWVEGDPAATLLVEFDLEQVAERDAVCDAVRELCYQAGAYAMPVLHEEQVDSAWAVRRAGLGMLMGWPGPKRPATLVEDVAVPPASLPAFVQEIGEVMAGLGLEWVCYGPVAVGAVHLRPLMDLDTDGAPDLFMELQQRVAACVKRHGGTVSAKHGDGRLRGHLLRHMLGSDAVALMRSVRTLFDPQDRFNPDIARIASPVRHWRRSDGALPVPRRQRPRAAGILEGSRRCNGAGVCLQRAGRGVMCPSYQATREERDSTRGRANVLREVLEGALPSAGLHGAEVAEVLDRCLGCKGCRRECPAGVDMAWLKAEVLALRRARCGEPRASRWLARMPRLLRLGRRLPSLANRIAASDWLRNRLDIHPERPLPPLAERSLSLWLRRRRPPQSRGDAVPVVLVNDLFSEYFEPGIGQAAVELLEAAGYRVRVTPVLSFGRLPLSLGRIGQARRELRRTLETLERLGDARTPVVGLEPSELLTLRDEAGRLLPGGDWPARIEALAARAWLFDEFMVRTLRDGPRRLHFRADSRGIVYHVHCHQKALAGTAATHACLDPLSSSVAAVEGGCCGMAGSFGYGREHYPLSRRIAELALAPAVREVAGRVRVVATGASCRQQIEQVAGVRAMHPAELLRSALVDGP